MTYLDIDLTVPALDLLKAGDLMLTQKGDGEVVRSIAFLNSSSGRLWTVSTISGKLCSFTLFHAKP